MNTVSTTAMSVREVSKAYHYTQALDRVSMEILPGKITAIVGKNGAGKSTLVKIISGLEAPDAGSIQYGVEDITKIAMPGRKALGIYTIPQELLLFPDLSITENIILPDIARHRSGRIHWKEAHSLAREAIQLLGIEADVEHAVAGYSPATQRAIMIARGLSRKAKVLILDEPTEAFTKSDIHRLFTILKRLSASGVAVIYISHRLDEVRQLADEIVILRDGRIVANGSIGSMNEHEIVAAIVGPTEPAVVHGASRQFTTGARDREACLSVMGVCGQRLSDVSLHVSHGEVVGLYGLNGSGCSELVRGIAGIDELKSGSITIGENDVTKLSLHRRKAAGIMFISDDRQAEGLFMNLTVKENIAIGMQSRSAHPWRRGSIEVERSLAAMEIVGLSRNVLDNPVSSLSGGNQQKVLIARGLLCDAKVWLLDEPTIGLDIRAREDLFRLLRSMISIGDAKGALVVINDYDDLVRIVDRVYVLRHGSIIVELSRTEIRENVLVNYATSAASIR